MRRVLVALDFDGTLAPFRDDPSDARMLPSIRAALEDLARAGVQIALISGRGLADLAARATPPDETILIGSHGAEWGMWSGGRVDPVAGVGEAAPHADGRLDVIVRDFEKVARDGAWVERKPAAAVLHTRPMPDREAGLKLRRRAAELARARGARVLQGDEVLEALISDMTKGQALEALREWTKAEIVVFAGDDVTDESALATLRGKDVGIKVGDGPSAAQIRVAGPEAMGALLALLAAVGES